MLAGLAESPTGVVVDVGCGVGRQTLVLARELQRGIHALDAHEPFLEVLQDRARAAGLDHLVETQCMDMEDVPDVFPQIGLLWSEGAVYNIGFGHALERWAASRATGAFMQRSPARGRRFY